MGNSFDVKAAFEFDICTARPRVEFSRGGFDRGFSSSVSVAEENG